MGPRHCFLLHPLLLPCPKPRLPQPEAAPISWLLLPPSLAVPHRSNSRLCQPLAALCSWLLSPPPSLCPCAWQIKDPLGTTKRGPTWAAWGGGAHPLTYGPTELTEEFIKKMKVRVLALRLFAALLTHGTHRCTPVDVRRAPQDMSSSAQHTVHFQNGIASCQGAVLLYKILERLSHECGFFLALFIPSCLLGVLERECTTLLCASCHKEVSLQHPCLLHPSSGCLFRAKCATGTA